MTPIRKGNPPEASRREGTSGASHGRKPCEATRRKELPDAAREEKKASRKKGTRPAGRGAAPSRTPREAALRVLTACQRDGAWADAALRAELERANLSPQDAALCSQLVYGVLQNRLLLDFRLAPFCTQRLEHLQFPLPDILRLGAFQILFLDRVPDHAAVHEAVELTRSAGRERAAGLVNAVLRKLTSQKDNLPPLPEGMEGLSIRYSHPLWLTGRVTSLLGEEEAGRFFRENNRIAPLPIRVNERRTTVETLREELERGGVSAEPHPWVPGCLLLNGAGDPRQLPAFREGRCYVQDPAAQLVPLIAPCLPGQAVLDVCAAPGGKSFGAAMAVGEGGSVLSCDSNARKLRHIREGALRLGLDTIIRTQEADGRAFHPDWAERFDVVLVDAPCSGLGIIRKKPEIRYKAETSVRDLPQLQRAILDNASRYVRPGGTLIYSTCTILPEENEGVTDGFLSSHPEFAPTPFSPLPKGEGGAAAERITPDSPTAGGTVTTPDSAAAGISPDSAAARITPGGATADCASPDSTAERLAPGSVLWAAGQLTLWPQRHGTDGFYIRRMVRSGSETPGSRQEP